MKLIHVEEPKHTERVGYKQAEEILRVKPDAVLFEYPTHKRNFLSEFNRFNPKEKPKQKILKWKGSYEVSSKKYPWLKSKYKIVEAIEQLWNEGKQVYLFEIDAPIELTTVVEKHPLEGYFYMLWNYLRDRYMIGNIKRVERLLDKKIGKNSIVLVFCHDFHWENIHFLSNRPTKSEILSYYFSQDKIGSVKEIESDLKKKNKILYKFWKLKSGF